MHTIHARSIYYYIYILRILCRSLILDHSALFSLNCCWRFVNSEAPRLPLSFFNDAATNSVLHFSIALPPLIPPSTTCSVIFDFSHSLIALMSDPGIQFLAARSRKVV